MDRACVAMSLQCSRKRLSALCTKVYIDNFFAKPTSTVHAFALRQPPHLPPSLHRHAPHGRGRVVVVALGAPQPGLGAVEIREAKVHVSLGGQGLGRGRGGRRRGGGGRGVCSSDEHVADQRHAVVSAVGSDHRGAGVDRQVLQLAHLGVGRALIGGGVRGR